MSLTSEQVRAARMLLRWEQRILRKLLASRCPASSDWRCSPARFQPKRTLSELRKALEKLASSHPREWGRCRSENEEAKTLTMKKDAVERACECRSAPRKLRDSEGRGLFR